MKKSTLMIGLPAMLMMTAATAETLPQLASPVEINTNHQVVINGDTYHKQPQASTVDFAQAVKLYAGDVVTKDSLSLSSKATGTIFVTLSSEQSAQSLAKDLGLELVFSHGKSAVFKAPAYVELLTLNETLNQDKRVQAVKIELANNKYLAE